MRIGFRLAPMAVFLVTAFGPVPGRVDAPALPGTAATPVWSPGESVMGGAARLAITGVGASGAASPGNGSWTLLSPPGARGNHAAVWDTAHNQMLVFAGANPTVLNDLWSYRPTSGSWTPLAPAGPAPTARYGHSAVWDPGDAQRPAQMLVYGGLCCTPDNLSLSGELWSYRPATNTWVQLTPSGPAPSARAAHSAVWDAANQQMLVFDGCCDASLGGLNDLWSYQPATNIWTPLNPVGVAPSGRISHAAVWDSERAQMLVFGGLDANGVLDDLWAYRPSGNSWARFPVPALAPAPRNGHSGAWDTTAGQMLVFGGQGLQGGSPIFFDDLWGYRPETNSWARIGTGGISPGARGGHSAVWEPGGAQMLLHGGVADNRELNDLWSYQPSTGVWTQRSLRGPIPLPRTGHTAAWEPTGGQMLVFGGLRTAGGDVTYLNDLWSYRPATDSWRQLSPAGPIPVARDDHSAVWDPGASRMLIFGGWNGQPLDDLWAYDPAISAWTQLLAVGPRPGAQSGHTAVWDPTGAQMLLSGGGDFLWSYQPSANRWTRLTPAAPIPDVRINHSAVWDPDNAQMLLFGGLGFGGSSGGVLLADLWSYRPATNGWTQLIAAGTAPPANQAHSAVWDAVNGRMLVFGGGRGQLVGNQLWGYQPLSNRWIQLMPAGPTPGGRLGHSAVWDSTGRQMLVSGGFGGLTGLLDDLWAYRPAPGTPGGTQTATATATPRPPSMATATPTPSPAGLLGGRGFGLQAGVGGAVVLSWAGGSQQNGYVLARGGASSALFGPLPVDAQRFVDTSAPAGLSCYVLFTLAGSPPAVAGISDVLCVINGLALGSVPGAFTLRLNELKVASLTWTPPGAQTGYVLVVLTAPGRNQLLPGAATSAMDRTEGAPSCYALQALSGPAPIGLTDILCAIPNPPTPAGGAAG